MLIYDFIIKKSPNLSKNEILANFIHSGGIPEYQKQLAINELNVTDWMLQNP